MEWLTVGQMAERAGVPATTLRYYDALGLLVPHRRANGHRRYPAQALDDLRLIKLCRDLGLTLEEVGAVLGSQGGQARRAIAARKLHDLDRTMARLAAARAVLAHFSECRHTAADADECRREVRAAMTAVLGEAVQVPGAPGVPG